MPGRREAPRVHHLRDEAAAGDAPRHPQDQGAHQAEALRVVRHRLGLGRSREGRVPQGREDSFDMPLEGQLDDPQTPPRADMPEVQRRHRHEEQGGHRRPGVLHYFQRAETMRAGTVVDFDVVLAINEPTAAAIAELSEALSPNKRGGGI